MDPTAIEAYAKAFTLLESFDPITVHLKPVEAPRNALLPPPPAPAAVPPYAAASQPHSTLDAHAYYHRQPREPQQQQQLLPYVPTHVAPVPVPGGFFVPYPAMPQFLPQPFMQDLQSLPWPGVASPWASGPPYPHPSSCSSLSPFTAPPPKGSADLFHLPLTEEGGGVTSTPVAQPDRGHGTGALDVGTTSAHAQHLLTSASAAAVALPTSLKRALPVSPPPTDNPDALTNAADRPQEPSSKKSRKLPKQQQQQRAVQQQEAPRTQKPTTKPPRASHDPRPDALELERLLSCERLSEFNEKELPLWWACFVVLRRSAQSMTMQELKQAMLQELNDCAPTQFPTLREQLKHHSTKSFHEYVRKHHYVHKHHEYLVKLPRWSHSRSGARGLVTWTVAPQYQL